MIQFNPTSNDPDKIQGYYECSTGAKFNDFTKFLTEKGNQTIHVVSASGLKIQVSGVSESEAKGLIAEFELAVRP